MRHVDRNRPRASGRLARVLRCVALVFVTLGLLAGGTWLWLDRKWGRELQGALAAMKRDGMLVPLDGLLLAPVSATQNAAPLYQEAVAACCAFEVRLRRGEWPGLIAYARGAPEDIDDPPLLSTRGESAHPVSAAAAERLLADADARKALRLFEVGSHKGACWYAVRGKHGPCPALGPAPASSPLNAVALVFARARSHLDAGRSGDAFRWYAIGLRIECHLAGVASREGLHRSTRALEDALSGVRVAVCQSRPAAAQAAALDALLGAADRTQADAATKAPRADLSMCNQFYDTLLRNPDRAYGFYGPLWAGSRLRLAARLYCTPVARPAQRLDYVRYLAAMRTSIALAPLRFRRARWRYELLDVCLRDANMRLLADDITSEGGPADALALLNCLRLPPAWRLLSAGYRELSIGRDVISARIGLIRTLLRLQAYRSSHGRYPPSLSALGRSLPKHLSEDPFSGRPFRYSPKGEGFRLYSVGPDLQDDAGARQATGTGPSDGGDIVVQWPRSRSRDNAHAGGDARDPRDPGPRDYGMGVGGSWPLLARPAR